MTRTMEEKADPSVPFHQSSFYVEDLKFGAGADGGLTPATRAEIAADLQRLLVAAGIDNMTGLELIDALDYYAESCARRFAIRMLVAKSIFTDGVLHGIAFAAGLKGEPR